MAAGFKGGRESRKLRSRNINSWWTHLHDIRSRKYLPCSLYKPSKRNGVRVRIYTMG